VGDDALSLLERLGRFVQRLTPPQGQHRYRDFVAWLEVLIGSDPALEGTRFPLPEEPMSLKVVTRIREAAPEVAEGDVAALQALKDVLRGLVWAEEAVDTGELADFPRFFDELVGVIEAATYRLPTHPEFQEITVADVAQARGVPFRAMAVLGLAEGEFPATLREDSFLRDADREQLGNDLGVPLERSTDSTEAQTFYETIARPWEHLLLTRPRMAENGALWQASPYWEEVGRLVGIQPLRLTSERAPEPGEVASWPELMESLVVRRPQDALDHWVRGKEPARLAALDAGTRVFLQRLDDASPSPFDGDLGALANGFGQHFGPDHTWSASRLENYRTCPFLFFIANVLGLEPREEPVEGLDARQLGTIYHRIFEELYQAPEVADPADLDQLMAALPVVAARVLDEAPSREGFRKTAWWEQTRAEIVENVGRSLVALDCLPGEFAPLGHEVRFFDGERLVVAGDGDRFGLHGVIDRVDRDSGGRLRIVDYKTSAPHAFTKRAVAEGKKLQLPLYALAARDALELGEPVEGFCPSMLWLPGMRWSWGSRWRGSTGTCDTRNRVVSN